MLTSPFETALQHAKTILIAGCGGGFDVFVGIPIALAAIDAGKTVVLANLSFTTLAQSGSEQLSSVLWRVDRERRDLPYFPEAWLAEWVARKEMELPIYAMARTGVVPLRAAFSSIQELHDVDLAVLVDGGTDSLIFGDEPGVGTVQEDAVSLVAATAAFGDRAILAAIGSGVDDHGGVSHYAFLQNTAQMIREGAYLGGFDLARNSSLAEAFCDLVDYANQRQPAHPSIVCNSIASAIRGEFGDYHATRRTEGSSLFISPLMAQYWTFRANAVVARMAFAEALTTTSTFAEACAVIERVREGMTLRPRQMLPL